KYIANERLTKSNAAITINQYESELTNYVIKNWGNRTAATITRIDANLLLKDMEVAKKTSVARRIKTNLSQVWKFGLNFGYLENNIMHDLILTGAKAEKDRALNADEIKQFFNSLHHLKSRNCIDILRLILLLGRRPLEVASAKWSDIDLESKNWFVETAKQRANKKVKDGIIIPLPDLAYSIFLGRFVENHLSDYVFQSEYDLLKHHTVHAVSQELNRKFDKLGITEPFTPHDLRRTCSTLLGKLDFDQEEIDRILGHKIVGISSIYNRHDYVEQRLKALTKLDAEIKRIIT
ncbi:MAG: tyrosine-type recombinase/integrase, partial [Oscillospiraceae bacterium]